MDDSSASNVLSKIQLLETQLGKLKLRPLAPFGVVPSDPSSLQEAARKLAAHVGLQDLTFIVALAKQAEGVGAHVELRYAQREVFIEIDSALSAFPETALMALAHEVTHKFLHHHEIWLPITLENERLTDIAAVFAGFGAIMLNGCIGEKVEINGNVRTVTKFTGGYLDQEELALVFAALEYLAPDANGREYLTEQAEFRVQAGERYLAEIWPSDKHGPDALVETLRESIRGEQAALAAIGKDITYLKEHALPSLEKKNRAAHLRLCEALGELSKLESSGSGRANKVRAAALGIEAREARAAVSRGSSARKIRKATTKAVGLLSALDELPNRSAEMFRVVRCPIDDSKLRIPAGKRRVAVRCPKCSYRFIADSTLDDVSVAPKKSGWFRR